MKGGLWNIKKILLKDGLIQNKGNISKTAVALGISRKTLQNWLVRFPDLEEYCSEYAQHIRRLYKEGNISYEDNDSSK